MVVFSLLVLSSAFLTDSLFFTNLSFISVAIAIVFSFYLSSSNISRASVYSVVSTGFAALIFTCLYLPASRSSFTRYDMDAMKWIDSTIGSRSVFLCNTGDAGTWVASLTGRRSINLSGLRSERVPRGDYIYIGSRSSGRPLMTRETLENDPARYVRVYSNSGGAQVWKVLK